MAKQRTSKAVERTRFIGDNDMRYEFDSIREFMRDDNPYKLKIYRIDHTNTKSSRVYGTVRAEDKKFYPPVEIAAVLNVGDSISKFMAPTSLNKERLESFAFDVQLADLVEMNLEIRQGDFVLYNDGQRERFLEITKASRVNSTHGGMGYGPVYMTLAAMQVDSAAIPDSLK